MVLSCHQLLLSAGWVLATARTKCGLLVTHTTSSTMSLLACSPFVELIQLLLCFLQLLLVLCCEGRIWDWVVQDDIHCCTDGTLVAVALRFQLVDPARVQACNNGDLHHWLFPGPPGMVQLHPAGPQAQLLRHCSTPWNVWIISSKQKLHKKPARDYAGHGMQHDRKHSHTVSVSCANVSTLGLPADLTVQASGKQSLDIW